MGLLLALTGVSGAGAVAGAYGRGDPLASSCAVQARSMVAPAAVPLGGNVAVVDDVVFSCPQRRRPLHVAVVTYAPVAAAAGLGAALNLEVNPWVSAGLVTYAGSAAEHCSVRPGAARWAKCLDAAVQHSGLAAGTAGLASAVYQGWKALVVARGDPRLRQAEEPVREVLAVLAATEAPPPGSCAAVRDELARTRADGIDVSLICPTGDCPMACFGSPLPPDRLPPQETYDRLAERLASQALASELRVAELTLRETVPPAFEIIPELLDPPATRRDAGALTWHLTVPAAAEQYVRFGVRALRTGNPVVVDTGYLAFTDSVGRSGSTTLAPRRVSVGWRAWLPVLLREQLDLDP